MTARMATSLCPSHSHAMSDKFKNYLIQFAHQHLDFRIQEIRSIVSLLDCEASLKENDSMPQSPFMEIGLQNEQDGRNIMNRSVLSKGLYELWAEGTSLTDVKEKIDKLPKEFTHCHANTQNSYRIRVETFNKKISSVEKIQKIEYLTAGPETVFQGKINLNKPDVSFHLLEFYKNDRKSREHPLRVYFGRWISDGQRDRIKEYHLQNRYFIANTSMDACLSMVMANLGQVRSNQLVMDPFVGSGGLLVSSAHFGAYVMGTDIDFMLLHARAKPSRAKQKMRSVDESVRNNLRQYGLEGRYIDVLVADASRHGMWRRQTQFDAIITDPPYGIREAASKIATVDPPHVKEIEGTPHYPQMVQYQLGDIYRDLLNFAAKFLLKGGRLVYWLPIYKPDYLESNIPQHMCLQLESNCEQPLNTTISRRLITMVKVAEYDDVQMNGGASIGVDHYEKQSFRQKYFKSVISVKNNRTKKDDNL